MAPEAASGSLPEKVRNDVDDLAGVGVHEQRIVEIPNPVIRLIGRRQIVFERIEPVLLCEEERVQPVAAIDPVITPAVRRYIARQMKAIPVSIAEAAPVVAPILAPIVVPAVATAAMALTPLAAALTATVTLTPLAAALITALALTALAAAPAPARLGATLAATRALCGAAATPGVLAAGILVRARLPLTALPSVTPPVLGDSA